MNTRLKLLFPHVPRTAGTTLRVAIIRFYGEQRVYEDYADDPPDPVGQLNIDPDGYCEQNWNGGYPYLSGKDVAVGHFWVKKYQPVQADIRATILREPLMRSLSTYHYWTSVPESPHPVHRYIMTNKLDFLGFIRLPMMRWLCCGVYFRDVDMGQFDYIIDHNRINSDWDRVVASFGITSRPPREHLNGTALRVADFDRKVDEFLSDPKKVAIARDLLADETRFYERYAR